MYVAACLLLNAACAVPVTTLTLSNTLPWLETRPRGTQLSTRVAPPNVYVTVMAVPGMGMAASLTVEVHRAVWVASRTHVAAESRMGLLCTVCTVDRTRRPALVV